MRINCSWSSHSRLYNSVGCSSLICYFPIESSTADFRFDKVSTDCRDNKASTAGFRLEYVSPTHLKDDNVSTGDFKFDYESPTDFRAVNVSPTDLRFDNVSTADLRFDNVPIADFRFDTASPTDFLNYQVVF